jgi:hypothetical protein
MVVRKQVKVVQRRGCFGDFSICCLERQIQQITATCLMPR